MYFEKVIGVEKNSYIWQSCDSVRYLGTGRPVNAAEKFESVHNFVKIITTHLLSEKKRV